MAFRSHSLPRRPLPRETIAAAAPAHLYVETGLSTPSAAPRSVPASVPHLSMPRASAMTLPPLHSTLSDGGRYRRAGRGNKAPETIAAQKEWLMKSQTPRQPIQHFFHTPRAVDVAPGHGSVSLTLSRSEESRNPSSEHRGRSTLRTERRLREDGLSARSSRDGVANDRSHSNFSAKMRTEMRRVEDGMLENDEREKMVHYLERSRALYEAELREQPPPFTSDMRSLDALASHEQRNLHLEQDLHSLRSLQHERRRGVEHYKILERNKLLEREVAEATGQLRAMTVEAEEAAKKDREIEDLQRQLQNAERVAEKMMAVQKAQLAEAHAQDLREVESEYKTALVEAVRENEMLQKECAVVQSLSRENERLKDDVDNLRSEGMIAGKDAELNSRMLEEVTAALEAAMEEKEELDRQRNVARREGDLMRTAKEEAMRLVDEALAEKRALQTAKASLEKALDEAQAEKEEVRGLVKQSREMAEAMERCRREIGRLKGENAGLARERDDLKEELISVLEKASEYQG